MSSVMPQVSKSSLTRNGVSVYYEHHRFDAGFQTVLLSHGYSATSAMWKDQISALGENYNVIAWDMRGHGMSDSPADQVCYSEQETVDDMAAILDACGVEKAVIGGLSLGGYMTLAFQLAYPERCISLMLFDTGPGYKSDTARNGWNKMAEARAVEFEEKGLAALGDGQEVRIAQHRDPLGLARAARGMLSQSDSRIINSLPDIDRPTLVLVGADDAAFLVPSEYMTLKIPGAKKVVLPDAGHAANIDQPALFNQAVLDFLRDAC